MPRFCFPSEIKDPIKHDHKFRVVKAGSIWTGGWGSTFQGVYWVKLSYAYAYNQIIFTMSTTTQKFVFVSDFDLLSTFQSHSFHRMPLTWMVIIIIFRLFFWKINFIYLWWSDRCHFCAIFQCCCLTKRVRLFDSILLLLHNCCNGEDCKYRISICDACVCSVGITYIHSLSGVKHHRLIYNSAQTPSRARGGTHRWLSYRQHWSGATITRRPCLSGHVCPCRDMQAHIGNDKTQCS